MTTKEKVHTNARDEILTAVKIITQEREEKQFHLKEVLEYLKKTETLYRESMIRTHVTSRCCANSPNHHGSIFNDYERIGRGLYRLNL